MARALVVAMATLASKHLAGFDAEFQVGAAECGLGMTIADRVSLTVGHTLKNGPDPNGRR